MRLSKFTDYSLRIAILAASRPGERVTIREAAELHRISEAHLKKVVLHLTRRGYLTAMRGHGGGFALARPPEEINLGALIRDTEPADGLVECYQTPEACLISRSCRLPKAFDQAMTAFWSVLGGYTLRDISLGQGAFRFPRPASAPRPE